MENDSCSTDSNDPRVQKAIEFIHQNFREDITVSDIARAVHLSESHLHHLFREHLSIGPLKYLNSFRMQQAERLIRDSDCTFGSVISRVGITDKSHFFRTFKRCYGVTPSQYRSSLRRNSKTAEAAHLTS